MKTEFYGLLFNLTLKNGFNLSLTVFNPMLTICNTGMLYFYIVEKQTSIQKFLHKWIIVAKAVSPTAKRAGH